MQMFGLSKALPLALAVAAMSLVSTNCGSSSNSGGQAQVRLINAIPDGPAIDVNIHGSKIFSNVAFGTVQPATTPASYVTAPGGSVGVQGFATGTTNPVAPDGVVTLNTATQYTMVAVGLEVNESAPLLVVDNSVPPMGNNIEVRVINASPSSPSAGVDVYIVPHNASITNFTPQISALTSSQASSYQVVPVASYDVIVTANFSKIALITLPSTPPAGSITTIVLVDNVGGNNGMSTSPLVLDDLD